MLEQADDDHQRAMLRVVLIYCAFAAAWIGLSDLAIEVLFADPMVRTEASIVKGWVFVGITALLLYGLMQRAWRRTTAAMQERLQALTLLEAVTNSSEDAIFAKDPAGRYLLFNHAAADFVGKPVAEVLGKDDRALFPADQAAALMETNRRVLAQERVETCEEYLETAHGPRTFLATKGPLRDAGGQVIGIFGIARDITERKRAEARTRQAATVFENTRESILITDLGGRILTVNPAFTEITGYREEEVINQNARLLQSGRHGPDYYQALWRSLTTTGQWQGEIWNRRKNGEIYPTWLTICTVRDEQGQPTHYVGVATDISQLKRSEADLLHLAHYDPLTDLPNRLLLQSRLEHALDRAQRHGHRVAVLFIDLDHFKTINDSQGHVVGDQLLVDVAKRLGERVREEDTLGRFGGDEFVLVLDLIDDPQAVASVAGDLLSLLATPFDLSGSGEVYVEASIGISIYPEDGRTATDLIRDADAAMYQAKKQGRNRFCFYTADMNANATAQLELEVALRRALEHEEFVLHFQPKADLRTGQIYGAEALIRWQPEGRELVLPGCFIPQAERSGLIIPIGNWVIDAACRQIQRWREAGLRDLRVAVNVSARQFRAGDLAAVVQAALVRHQVPPGSLELELTESVLMEDPEAAVGVLGALKRLGVHLSLDDFGTGYSSFTYLSRFPIDALKIDQSFVRDVVTDPQAAMIALSIIDLAHRLHLKVVAEGVETEAQLGYLRRRDCDEMQGYYFAHPMPAAELESLLGAGKCLPPRSASADPEGRMLLIVDDEPGILSALRRLLRQEGFSILTAESGRDALELLATHEVQVIVSDQRMPGMTGTDFLGRAKELHPDTVRMILSGYSDLESVTQAVNAGAIYKFLHKPWDDAQLRQEIRDAFRYYEQVILPRHPEPTDPQV